MKRRNAYKGLTTSHNGLVYKNAHATQTAQQTSPSSPNSLLKKQNTMINAGATRIQTGQRTSSVTSEGPKPRDGHVALQLNNNMFVFGGDRHQVPFNDLFFLPLEGL